MEVILFTFLFKYKKNEIFEVWVFWLTRKGVSCLFSVKMNNFLCYKLTFCL